MSIFFRPYLLTDGRSLSGVIVFSGRPGYHFIYDECVLEEIRQDWASFVFGVWFLCVRRGSILIEGGCFWSGNGGFRVELTLFWSGSQQNEKKHLDRSLRVYSQSNSGRSWYGVDA